MNRPKIGSLFKKKIKLDLWVDHKKPLIKKKKKRKS